MRRLTNSIVIVRLLVLLFAVLGTSCGPSNFQKAMGTVGTIRSIACDLADYKRNHGSYPTTGAEGVDCSTIRALIAPESKAEWYLDSWQRPVRYKSDGTHFEIRSLGADGVICDCNKGPEFRSTDDLNCDIVLRDEQFVAAPSGIST